MVVKMFLKGFFSYSMYFLIDCNRYCFLKQWIVFKESTIFKKFKKNKAKLLWNQFLECRLFYKRSYVWFLKNLSRKYYFFKAVISFVRK